MLSLGFVFLARRHLRVAAGPVVASKVLVSRILAVLCAHLDLLFGVLCHVRRFLVICRRQLRALENRPRGGPLLRPLYLQSEDLTLTLWTRSFARRGGMA